MAGAKVSSNSPGHVYPLGQRVIRKRDGQHDSSCMNVKEEFSRARERANCLALLYMYLKKSNFLEES